MRGREGRKNAKQKQSESDTQAVASWSKLCTKYAIVLSANIPEVDGTKVVPFKLPGSLRTFGFSISASGVREWAAETQRAVEKIKCYSTEISRDAQPPPYGTSGM